MLIYLNVFTCAMTVRRLIDEAQSVSHLTSIVGVRAVQTAPCLCLYLCLLEYPSTTLICILKITVENGATNAY